MQSSSNWNQAKKSKRRKKGGGRWNKQQQLSSNNTTLDLHGYHQNQALRAVTDYLEHHRNQNSTCVILITGTGSHSMDGPVLRSAIEQLLQRRQMKYERNTPGSLKVNPMTGIVFSKWQSSAEDTKLIVVDSNGHNSNNSSSNSDALSRFIHKNHSTNSTSSSLSLSTTASVSRIQFPLVLDMAKEEETAAISRSKAASLELLRQEQRMAREESYQYQKALQESSLNQTKDALQQQQDQKQLEEALALSQQHEAEMKQKADQIEQELVQEAMEQSEQEAKLAMQEEEEALQQAIRLSQQEQENFMETDDDDDDDEILQKVLEQSKLECTSSSRSTSTSGMYVCDPDEEDRLLEEVLARSRREQTIFSDHY